MSERQPEHPDYKALLVEAYEAGIGHAVAALIEERDALQAQLEAVRKYADERAWYAAQNRTVSSYRIASDLFHILGLGPDGKEPASDG